MKGPSERLKYDLLRVWECPECRHRCRTGGDATTSWCDCTIATRGTPVPMKLLEDDVRRRSTTHSANNAKDSTG